MTDRSVPTLADVAAAAGVSTATVSRCLNEPHRVVGRTRAKVLEAVQALGYTPNFGARAMAAKRTNTVGAIIPTMDNAIFARGLQAFQEALHEAGYTLLVATSNYRAEEEEEQIRSLVARGADGLLLIGHERDPAVLEFLDARGIPALVAWTFDDQAALPSIGFDNHRSMGAIADQVFDLGHRRIGYISGHLSGNDRARRRMEGARDALRARGVAADAFRVVETHYVIDAAAQAFRELMETAEPPTAVMGGNDVLAVGAMMGARAMGLSVPADVSITGFDDLELAQIVDPPLATVRVPHRAMGDKAARMLIKMVQDKVPGQSERLATDLHLRGSLAAPPACK